MGTCYASITGVMDLDTAAQVRTDQPDRRGEPAQSTGCN